MFREIRAGFGPDTIRVYQAYNDAIADAAVRTGTFGPPTFSLNRMTWIKPSFLWMMYRCGWGEKDANQKRVLAIDIKRSGFEQALERACISHYETFGDETQENWRNRLSSTDVRIQWDPERNIDMQPLPHRSLQIGLSGESARKYVEEWIVSLTDITDTVRQLNAHRKRGEHARIEAALPKEEVYPISDRLKAIIHAS